MGGLADALGQRVTDERRETKIHRKGTVTKVTAGTPTLVVIDGRSMPYLGPDLVVGDIVTWINIADPFAIGKFAGT